MAQSLGTGGGVGASDGLLMEDTMMLLRQTGTYAQMILLTLLASGCGEASTASVEKTNACDVRPDKAAAPSASSNVAASERVTYRDQVRGAEVIMVGTVQSSEIKPMRGANDFDIPLRTTTFAVECMLRGRKTDTEFLEVAELFGEDHAMGLTRGGTYLVFAERRTLLGEYRRLVPMGAAQGVYPVDNQGRAVNEANGGHDLAKVVREVESAKGA